MQTQIYTYRGRVWRVELRVGVGLLVLVEVRRGKVFYACG